MRSAEQIGVQVLGCKIVLDDFGTGYSWLADITRLPADRIKINKALVRDLDRSTCDAAVASAILSLAQGRGITVTAEGYRARGAVGVSQAQGCDEVTDYPTAAKEQFATAGRSTLAYAGVACWTV